MEISYDALEAVQKQTAQPKIPSKPRRKLSTDYFPQVQQHEPPKVLAPLSGVEGTVEFPVSTYLYLLQAAALQQTKLNSQPPQNFFISKAVYTGIAQYDAISLQITFDIIVLHSAWTQIKLLPDSVGMSNHSVVFSNRTTNNTTPDDTTTSTTTSTTSKTGGATVGVLHDGFYLVASQAGSYKVECNVLVQYGSKSKSGMMLEVCKAAHNQITFTVPDKDVQLKVDPALNPKSESTPTTLLDAASLPSHSTMVSVMFPPTRMLSVQWTEKAESSSSTIPTPTPTGAVVEEKKSATIKNKLMITAEQSSLCSVGEGIMVIATAYKFQIVHGSVSSYDIQISKSVNVLSVEGLGIKKWEVIDLSPKGKKVDLVDGAVEATPTKNKSGEVVHKILRVILDYGLEDAYKMTITSEVSMGGTSADLEIPIFRCLGEDISREKGYLAVEARTNVEVNEISREGLAMVDISEIPQALTSLASTSLLFGYKFLDPNYRLSLRVKRHADVGVLIATCEDAYFVTTVSLEGKVLHKLTLKIRNTQKQYVRITIPFAYDIWSTSVAGSAIKPAKDEEGRVMIPLQKSTAKPGESSSNNESFTVELIFIETEEREFGQRGEIGISFASIDLPINNLAVSLYLPNEYEIGPFLGDLKEVQYFSKNPPVAPDASYSSSSSSRNNAFSQQVQMQSNFRSYDDDDMPSEKLRSFNSAATKYARGVLPVQVQMTTNGQEFKFEQLLVMQASLTVTTNYNKKKQVDYTKNRRPQHHKLCCEIM